MAHKIDKNKRRRLTALEDFEDAVTDEVSWKEHENGSTEWTAVNIVILQRKRKAENALRGFMQLPLLQDGTTEPDRFDDTKVCCIWFSRLNNAFVLDIKEPTNDSTRRFKDRRGAIEAALKLGMTHCDDPDDDSKIVSLMTLLAKV